MKNLFWKYESQRRFEAVQVVLAWGISYMFFLAILVLQLALSMLFIGALTVSAWQQPNVSLTLGMVVLLLVLLFAYNLPQIHVAVRIQKFLRAARDLRGLEELPHNISTLVLARIDGLKSHMTEQHQREIERCNIKLFLERMNHKATPCMITISRELNIIFPLGFFKVLKGDPEAADAMLAHELAHYLHRDSGLLLRVRCYLKAAVVNFYYLAIMFALILAFAVINVFHLHVQKLGLEGQLADVERSRAEIYKERWPRSYDFRLTSLALEEANLRGELHRKDVETLIWIGRPAKYVLTFPIFALSLLYLRRRVHRSEEIADLFACLVTHPTAVKRFLAEYLEDADYGIKSLHPRTSKRVELARRYEDDLV